MPQEDPTGEQGRIDVLLPAVYDELHAIAAQHMRRERRDHTLQTTALVHEAYLRLNQNGERSWRSRSEFVAAAAVSIRRILIEHARKHGALKRGGDYQRCALEDVLGISPRSEIDVIEIDEALCELARFDTRMARVVELRFFGGLTVDEVADVLGHSKRTIESDWTLARAWLRRHLDRTAAP